MPNSIELDFCVPSHKREHLDAQGRIGESLVTQLTEIPGILSVDKDQPTSPGLNGRVILRIDSTKVNEVQAAIRTLFEDPNLSIKTLDY